MLTIDKEYPLCSTSIPLGPKANASTSSPCMASSGPGWLAPIEPAARPRTPSLRRWHGHSPRAATPTRPGTPMASPATTTAGYAPSWERSSLGPPPKGTRYELHRRDAEGPGGRDRRQDVVGLWRPDRR